MRKDIAELSTLPAQTKLMPFGYTMKLVLAAVLCGVMIMPLSGCGQKSVKVDQAEETAKVEETGSARPSDKSDAEKAASAKVDSAAFSEGAGEAESLETPTGHEGRAGMVDPAAVVEGSRTSVGLLPIYFDFDKSLVRPDQAERLEANALFLRDNPGIEVRIEGNCDNRGSNEYNMALGERRARGAKRYLVNLGIADSRLGILSYGEERPLIPGNDEAAWTVNRRGDFVIVR